MAPHSTEACKKLKAAVAGLHASGIEGFEGLIRDAYREVTGVSLRLQKSGTQHGADAVSAGSENTIRAGIEAKRYRDTTVLPLDELKAKLVDAATATNNPVELWIVAASREIPGTDAAELQRLGDQQGLGILVLDWRGDADPTAPLPLLLSMAPGAVRQHLKDEIADALSELHTHAGYSTQRDKLLERLRHPDMGLSHAARAVRNRIAETLRSRADAKAQIQNPVDMKAPARIWVTREGLCNEIGNWQKQASGTPVCAVVGDEGLGKTWLMFDWWQQETEAETPPLIVWFPARDVATSSLAVILGFALAKWISVPNRDAAFWTARVELWRRVHGPDAGPPLIWLMLDGVNEGSSQSFVSTALNEAVSSEWKGRVGVLLSDRPGHWQQRFLGGKNLETPAQVVDMPKFTNAELDGLLTQHGKSRSEFSNDVVEIIRWPSWFAVAATLFSSGHDLSAHSPEQLMVRYWQHKLHERGAVATIDDDTFLEFIADLGRRTKENLESGTSLSRAELKTLLPGSSGASEAEVMSALSDLTSGLWMKKNGPHQFNINKEVLPFAIGLALVSELRATATREQADAACEQFLGPLEAQSIGASIYAAAVSLTFIDASFPEHAKHALVARWIEGHNFSSENFQLLWRAAGISPGLFFSVAEQLWLQCATRHSVDEILIKSIANIATDAGKMEEVIAFAAKWAATYWDDPQEGAAIGYRPTQDQTKSAKDRTAARLAKLRGNLGDAALRATGLRHCDNGQGASWLCHRILALCTYLPRERQDAIWRGWVLSRAVMDSPRHHDELAWSLRLNAIDGRSGATKVIETADELIALNAPTLRPYVAWLLCAEGSVEAEARLSGLSLERPARGRPYPIERAEIVNGKVKLSRSVRAGRQVAFRLSDFALNPHIDVAQGRKSQLAVFAKGLPVDELSIGHGRTSGDVDLDRAEAALARWAPRALADIHLRWLATFGSRDEKAARGFALSLDDILVLMPPEAQQAITAALISRMSAVQSNSGQIEQSLWAAAIFDRTAQGQYKVWRDLGAPEAVRTSLQYLLRPVPARVLLSLAKNLAPGQDRGRLVSWLSYLFAAGSEAWPEDWEPLWRLFGHEDATVRRLALNIAVITDDRRLSERLRQTDWKASSDRSVEENYWGSCLLIQDASPANVADIRARIDSQWSDALWKKLGYAPDHRHIFEDFLTSSVERECNPPEKRTFPEYRCSPLEATQEVLKQSANAVVSLADRLFDHESSSGLFAEQWPRLELLKAFFQEDPARAVAYCRKLDERWERIVGKSEKFEAIAFTGKDDSAVDGLRVDAIRHANNDWKLMTLAAAIAGYDKTDWAVGWIKRTIADPSCSADVARALTLAGFLAPSPSAKSLWENELRQAPASEWLERVHGVARRRAERAAHALHWLEETIGARSNTEFFSRWRLFILSADYRILPVAVSKLKTKMESMEPRHSEFIEYNWNKVRDKTRKEKNELERMLFATRVGFSHAVPWDS